MRRTLSSQSIPKILGDIGESIETLRAILTYCIKHRPKLVILENVQKACGLSEASTKSPSVSQDDSTSCLTPYQYDTWRRYLSTSGRRYIQCALGGFALTPLSTSGRRYIHCALGGFTLTPLSISGRRYILVCLLNPCFDAFVHEYITPNILQFAFVTLDDWDLRVQLPREA